MFDQKPERTYRLHAKCRIDCCKSELRPTFADKKNLTKRFRVKHCYEDDNKPINQECASWWAAYKSFAAKKPTTRVVSKHIVNFLKLFCNRSMTMEHLEDPYLWPVLHPDLKLPCYEVFRTRLIPWLMSNLRLQIDEVLCSASSVVLVPDGWTFRLTTSSTHRHDGADRWTFRF